MTIPWGFPWNLHEDSSNFAGINEVQSCKPYLDSHLTFAQGSAIRKEWIGTEGRTRTDTELPQPDFESGASTSFATPARGES